MILLLLLFLHTGLKLVKQQAPLSNQPHTDDKMLQQTNVKTVALCGFCVAVVIFMVILQRRYLFRPFTICSTKRITEWVDSVLYQRTCGNKVNAVVFIWTQSFRTKSKAVRSSAIQLQYKKKILVLQLCCSGNCTCADRLRHERQDQFRDQQSKGSPWKSPSSQDPHCSDPERPSLD